MSTADHGPRPRRASCLWKGVVILLLSAVLLGVAFFAQEAERHRRAPVVVDLAATGCSLSPSGRFLRIVGGAVAPGDFFDADTGERIPISLPVTAQRRELWLRDDTFFVFSQWQAAFDPGSGRGSYALPENGWLIDVHARVVTEGVTITCGWLMLLDAAAFLRVGLR
jgi:hypothetical protein